MTTLLEMYRANYDEVYDRDDLEYRLYIQDHKPQILQYSSPMVLDANQQARYRYRPRWFLYENRFPELGDWVLLFLNDMTGPMEFRDIRTVIIPSWNYIETFLYPQYRTLSSRLDSAKKILMSAN